MTCHRALRRARKAAPSRPPCYRNHGAIATICIEMTPQTGHRTVKGCPMTQEMTDHDQDFKNLIDDRKQQVSTKAPACCPSARSSSKSTSGTTIGSWIRRCSSSGRTAPAEGPGPPAAHPRDEELVRRTARSLSSKATESSGTRQIAIMD